MRRDAYFKWKDVYFNKRDVLFFKLQFLFGLGVVVYFSALEHCRKMKFSRYIHPTIKQNLFILLLLSDFVACSPSLYIWSHRPTP